MKEVSDIQRIVISRIVIIIAIFSISLCLLLCDWPYLFQPHRHLLQMALNIGHIPLFGFVAWMVLLGINLKNYNIREWSIRSYILAFLFTVGISLVSELVQIVLPRSSSIKDFYFNALGAFLFLGTGLLWFNKQFLDVAVRGYKYVRVMFMIGALITVLVVIRPLIRLAIDQREVAKDFPMIASFETEREVRRWKGEGSKMSLSKEWVVDGKHSLCVVLFRRLYPGITLTIPPKDWRGYDSLQFTIFNPSKKSLILVLKIFDGSHIYTFRDRFNKVLQINYGENFISVPLGEIESAPAGRKMRMDRIAQVSFFMGNLKNRQVLFFDNICLSMNYEF